MASMKPLAALATTVSFVFSMSCGGSPSETTGHGGSGGATGTGGASAGGADAGDDRVKVPASFDVEAHRGGRGLRPENTLPAFENALDLGVDTLEMDLHFTKDDVVVVWHDPTVSRTKCAIDPLATAPLPPDPDALPEGDPALAIRALSLSDVQKYRCDRNPDPVSFPSQSNAPGALAGDDHRIQTLADVLDFVAAYSSAPEKTPDQKARAATVRFNIESKREEGKPETIGDGFDGMSPGPFEVAFVAEITQRSLAPRTIIQSFDHRSLWAVRKLDTTIALSALTKLETIDFVDYATKGATHWSPPYQALPKASVDAAHAAGLLVLPWTVNREIDMRHLIADGADGLITDVPDVLNGIIDRQP
jgi:glycerophosphoryl diester phosphodiesterase